MSTSFCVVMQLTFHDVYSNYIGLERNFLKKLIGNENHKNA